MHRIAAVAILLLVVCATVRVTADLVCSVGTADDVVALWATAGNATTRNATPAAAFAAAAQTLQPAAAAQACGDALCVPASPVATLPPIAVVCSAVAGQRWVNATALDDHIAALSLTVVTTGGASVRGGASGASALQRFDPRSVVPLPPSLRVVGTALDVVAAAVFPDLQLLGATTRGATATLCLTAAWATADERVCNPSVTLRAPAPALFPNAPTSAVVVAASALRVVVVAGSPTGLALLHRGDDGLLRRVGAAAARAPAATTVAGNIAAWSGGCVVVVPASGHLGVAVALTDPFGNFADAAATSGGRVLLRLTAAAASALEMPLNGSRVPVSAAAAGAIVAVAPSGGPFLLAAVNATLAAFDVAETRLQGIVHGVRYRVAAAVALDAQTTLQTTFEVRLAECHATWDAGVLLQRVSVNGTAECVPLQAGARLVGYGSGDRPSRPRLEPLERSEVYALAPGADVLAPLPPTTLWTAVLPGYWRAAPSATSPVLRCQRDDACVGGLAAAACAEGHRDTLCYTCEPHFLKDENGACYRCVDPISGGAPVTLLIAMVVGIFIATVPKYTDAAHVPAAAVLCKMLLTSTPLIAMNQPFVARMRVLLSGGHKVLFLVGAMRCLAESEGAESNIYADVLGVLIMFVGMIGVCTVPIVVARALAGRALGRFQAPVEDFEAHLAAAAPAVDDLAELDDTVHFSGSQRSVPSSHTSEELRTFERRRAQQVAERAAAELRMQRVALDMLRQRRARREAALNDEVAELPRSFEKRRKLRRSLNSSRTSNSEETFLSAVDAAATAANLRSLEASGRSNGKHAHDDDDDDEPDDRTIEHLLRDERVERDNFILARIERARRAVDPALMQLAEREIIDALDVVNLHLATLRVTATPLGSAPAPLNHTATPLPLPGDDTAALQHLHQALGVLTSAENAAAVSATLPKQPAASAASTTLLVAPSTSGSDLVSDADVEWQAMESPDAAVEHASAFWDRYDRREHFFLRAGRNERTWVRPSFVHPTDTVGVMFDSGSRLGLSAAIPANMPLTASVAAAWRETQRLPLRSDLVPQLLRPHDVPDPAAASAASPYAVHGHPHGACAVCRIRSAEHACGECAHGAAHLLYCALCWDTAHHPETPSSTSLVGAPRTRRSNPSRRRFHQRLPLDAVAAPQPAQRGARSGTPPQPPTPLDVAAASAFQVGYDACFREMWTEARRRPITAPEVAWNICMLVLYLQLPIVIYLAMVQLSCRTVPGTRETRLLHDPNIDCGSDAFALARLWPIAMLLLSAATAVLFGAMPYLLRRRRLLFQRLNLAKFSIVYSDLHPKRCWFTGVLFTRHIFTTVATTELIDRPELLVPLGILVTVAFMGATLALKPYRKGRLYMHLDVLLYGLFAAGGALSVFYNGGVLPGADHSEIPHGVHAAILGAQLVLYGGALLLMFALQGITLKAFLFAQIDVPSTIVATWQEAVIFARARAFATHKRAVDEALAQVRRTSAVPQMDASASAEGAAMSIQLDLPPRWQPAASHDDASAENASRGSHQGPEGGQPSSALRADGGGQGELRASSRVSFKDVV